MPTIYLLTGSNLGDSTAYLAEAAKQIEQKVGKIVRRSSLYETAPWGITNQPAFLNQALQVETSLKPAPLMEVLLTIENEMGRKRGEKYGPRTIDIDQLFYEDLIIQNINLVIPHPEIQHRRFVLVPLCEIAPHFVHPLFKRNMLELLNDCTDHSNVQKKLMV
jgi:2-amino-4-hydroxy-6-hydroxymethyldihydropteridine diphosphokinase